MKDPALDPRQAVGMLLEWHAQAIPAGQPMCLDAADLLALVLPHLGFEVEVSGLTIPEGSQGLERLVKFVVVDGLFFDVLGNSGEGEAMILRTLEACGVSPDALGLDDFIWPREVNQEDRRSMQQGFHTAEQMEHFAVAGAAHIRSILQSAQLDVATPTAPATASLRRV